MRLFIDCEFNEFKGDLISMAIVAENGEEFYEVLDCPNPGPWVKEHVMPILNKDPIPYHLFQLKLQFFLMKFNSIELIADWPEDIKHFCECLILDKGCRLDTPHLTMTIHRISTTSALPHNALEDARGIADYFLYDEILKGQE